MHPQIVRAGARSRKTADVVVDAATPGEHHQPMARSSRRRSRLRGRHIRGSVRVAVSVGAGLTVYGVCATLMPWQLSSLIGWDATVMVFVGWVWATILSLDPSETRELSTVEDDSRAAADAILIGASLVSLIGVGLTLLRAATDTSGGRDVASLLAFLTVLSSWAAVQTVFALRYARVFYGGDAGIDFHGGGAPDYRDFAYIALTIGMTYQVSDSELTSKAFRRLVVRQALLSYLFGIIGIAITINVVASLLTR
jgi:uncharacterized membrane protein